MRTEIIVEHVNKVIKTKQILKDINLQLLSGTVYGFVGRNGSGKTMLFRALSGLMKVTSVSIQVNGQQLYQDISFLPSLGITIENVGLYPEHTGYTNLKLLARIKGIADEDAIRCAIRRVGLDDQDRRPFKKYSLGMKQRIVIAQAIMEKPDVLILDEPTNSLDEDGISLTRNIVQEEKERGALILIASHNKEDIQQLCDESYFLKEGQIAGRVGT